jgi:hypothetical protein
MLSARAEERVLQVVREEGHDPLHFSYRRRGCSFDRRRDRLSAAIALILVHDLGPEARCFGGWVDFPFISSMSIPG